MPGQYSTGYKYFLEGNLERKTKHEKIAQQKRIAGTAIEKWEIR